ncbi:MAG: leucine-rich repeat protein [Kiritimatiellia bacterium]
MMMRTLKAIAGTVVLWAFVAMFSSFTGCRSIPTGGQLQFICTTNNDNTITLAKYIGVGGAVTVPSTFAGLPLTCIGDNAFRNCTNLTSVTIPRSVIQIRNFVFLDCTNLVTVKLPDMGDQHAGEATDKAYEVQVKTLRTSNCYLLRIQNVTPTRNEAPATDYAVRFCPLITVNYGNHLLVMLFTRPPSSSPTDTAV